MNKYDDQFEGGCAGLDFTFEGVGKSNEERVKHLYPYEIDKLDHIMHATSAAGMQDRVAIVGYALLNNARVG